MIWFVVFVCVSSFILKGDAQTPSQQLVQAHYEHHQLGHHDKLSRIVTLAQDSSETLHPGQTIRRTVTEIPCPKGCQYHGKCNFTSGTCDCDSGWYGDNCGKAYRCVDSCNYHGQCLSNKCVCAPGFSGEACEVDERCPENCNGHGECLNAGTECLCDKGWVGETCERKEIPEVPQRLWKKVYPPEVLNEMGAKPEPRHSHGIGLYGPDSSTQQVIIWGGKNGQIPLDNMWVYDFGSHSWQQKFQRGSVRPGPRYDFTMTTTEKEKELIMFGGYEPCESDSLKTYSAELWSWSFEKEEWSLLPMILESGVEVGPVGRIGHSMVRIESSLFIFGGKGQEDVTHSDTWRYSLTTGKWMKLASSPFGSRRFHTATAIDGKSFVVFGGLDADNVAHNDIYRYSIADDSWTTVYTPDDKGPPERSRHSAFFKSNQLYIFSGVHSAEQQLNDMWTYDFSTSTWKNINAGGLTLTSSSASILIRNNIVLMIGGQVDGQSSAQVLQYNFNTNFWEEQKTVGGLPSRRLMHSGNIIENKLWVYGGIAPTGQYLDDFWDFDFVDSVWSLHAPTSVVAKDASAAYICGSLTNIDQEEGANSGVISISGGVLWPGSRSGHSTTVIPETSSLCGDYATLLLFGGVNSESSLNDIWYWCPGTQQWSEISLQESSKPSPRSSSAILFTGKEIIVFGGMDANKLRLNDMWSCGVVSGVCSEITLSGSNIPHTRRSMNLHFFDAYQDNSLNQFLLFGGYWKEKNACSNCAGVVRKISSNWDEPMDVWRFETNYKRWKRVNANDSPEQRFCTESFLHKHRLFMFGGYAIDGILEHNDMWYLNVPGQQWVRLPATDNQPCPVGRHEHTFDKWIDKDGKMFAVVYGGIGTSGLLDDIWITDLSDVLKLNDLVYANDNSTLNMHKGAAVRHVVV